MRQSILFLCLVALGCASCTCKSRWPGGMVIGSSGGPVAHVVVFYLTNPGDADARRRIIETSHTFKDIPGVLSVQAGPAIPSTRPVVDSTYDVAVVLTFVDEPAL